MKVKPYIGAMYEVRPGDILTFDRIAEYREFMAKKHQMNNIKVWGLNEKWEDSGARPFSTTFIAKPLSSEPEEEKNEFE